MWRSICVGRKRAAATAVVATLRCVQVPYGLTLIWLNSAAQQRVCRISASFWLGAFSSFCAWGTRFNRRARLASARGKSADAGTKATGIRRHRPEAPSGSRPANLQRSLLSRPRGSSERPCAPVPSHPVIPTADGSGSSLPCRGASPSLRL